MPLNLAILDMGAAEGVTEDYPSVARWYIGGHSLGGFAASAYLNEAKEDYEGLILLGAYTQSNLTALGLRALSIYGSEDGVLNMENYRNGLPLLPKGYTEIVIDGGCHAYFGAYGEQAGDGVPTISREKQMEVTAEEVTAFVLHPDLDPWTNE
jgi:pimeloyl-ACP methyl ester carboxylesterase